MDVLFNSATFWILFLTVLGVFLGNIYLTALHGSLGGILGNLSVADVLMKSMPLLSFVTVLLYFLATYPGFTWHNSIQQTVTSHAALAGILLPLTAFAGLLAHFFGKIQAWRTQKSKKKVDIYGQFPRDSVIVLATTKDFVSCYDPAERKCYMISWSGITHIETSSTP